MENEKMELKQNLMKNQPGALKDIITYCEENINSININDKTDYYLCNISTIYLMKQKIGHFDENEAKFLTVYFAKLGAKLYARAHSIEGKINIGILPEEEYKKLEDEESMAVCIQNKDNSHTLIYSEEKVCQKLMTNNPDEFLRAMQTIFHEVVHVYQNIRMQRNYKDVSALQAKRGYRMALEQITRQAFPKFYNENYAKLFKENDAEEWGLKLALDILKIYNKGVYELFNEEEIQSEIERYRKRSEEEKNILGEGINVPMLKTMEFIAQNAPDFRKLYPILEVAYHEDGPRKSITELLDDREERIANGEPSIDDANELLLEILNSRDTTPEEKREEIKELDKYIVSRRTEDEFVYELLSNRLQRYGVKETAIQKYIEMTRIQVKGERELDEINKDEENIVQTITAEQKRTSNDEKDRER